MYMKDIVTCYGCEIGHDHCCPRGYYDNNIGSEDDEELYYFR